MEIHYSVILEEVREFNGSNCIEILGWMGVDSTNPELHTTDRPVIHSDDRDYVMKPGDLIGVDKNGEFYYFPQNSVKLIR